MNTIGVITVRLSSTRLPNKALLLMEGKTFLEHLVERVSLSKTLNNLVIATTDNPIDKEIVALAQKNHWNFFVGDEFNVLKRLIDAGEKYHVSHLVRITADNIFTDPGNIDRMVKSHIANNADYTVTSQLPLGITAEVIKFTALKYLQKIANNNPEVQEHITPYIRNHPNQFKINIIQAPIELCYPKYRLTTDYPEDMKVIKAIFKYFYSKAKKGGVAFSLFEIINFLNSRPEIVNINAHLIHPKANFRM